MNTRRVAGFGLCVAAMAVSGLVALRAYAHEGHEHADARKPANVMGHEGAPWLERPERIKEEMPDEVVAAMNLKDGDVVADVGCGSGFFTRRLAKAVGPTGKVYAVDIQPEMLEILQANCEKDGITNVIPVLGTENDPKLPKGEIDWILLVDTYHEFQDPAAMLATMHTALGADGKVALIEYRLLGETAKHIQESHRMSVKQVLLEWHPEGYELIDLLDFLPSQHYFIFKKLVKK